VAVNPRAALAVLGLLVPRLLAAQPAADERALADVYGAPAVSIDGSTWRIGDRVATILLQASFQEANAPHQLWVAQARREGEAAGTIGAILYRFDEGEWRPVARGADVVASTPGASRGDARLQRLSAGRHGFLVQETATSGSGSSASTAVVMPRGEAFAVLARLPTDYRGAGGGEFFRGCGPSLPPSLPCVRRVAMRFVRGTGELDDLALEIRGAVEAPETYLLPTENARYVFDGDRYRPAVPEAEAVSAAVESFFAEWLESRARGVTLAAFAAASTRLSPELRAAWSGEPPRGGTVLDRPAASRHGYVAVGPGVDGDQATVEALPIESAARGGAGRITLRLVRDGADWRIAEIRD
jgi:hypothetical protein